MPKFLILQSPNKSNLGTITHRDDENFYKPTFYKITDEEIEIYSAMNAHAKAAYLAEKLEAQMGTPIQVKKKVAPIVEVVESQEEHVSVEIPETEIEEPLNEPVNETENDLDTKFVEAISEAEYNEIKEEFKPVVDEMISNAAEEIVKAKRAYNKKVK